jgi:creatinine amidohydrolase
MSKDTDTVLIEELAWTEVADRLESGYDTALLACGAIEQHGPHLPTGVDTYLGYAMAEYVARELGNALVAPTLRPGCSDHHTDFPGTFSISRETFVNLLTDYCESLDRMGFDHIVLFPSHGGNIDIMKTYAPKIARDLERAEIYFVGLDFVGIHEYLAEEEGVSSEQAGVHAGYSETAQMLADYPDLVDMDKAEEGMTEPEFYAEERIPQSQQESFTHGVRQQVANGILGDARGATAEVGQEIKERRGDAMAEEIRERIDSEFLSMDVPDSVAHEYE